MNTVDDKIKIGHVFIFGGAEQEITEIKDFYVVTERTDTKFVTVWDPEGLKTVLDDPDYYK